MTKKYEFTEETMQVFGKTLHRIRALRDFSYVKAGELGGFIEKEENLSHDGNAWICDDAQVCDGARVRDDAWVCDGALVSDSAQVCGGAQISGRDDYLCFKGLGSENRNTTFFKCNDGHIHVKCGCFNGTLAEFEEKVKETHGDSKYAKEYLACVQVVKIHFGIEEEVE